MNNLEQKSKISIPEITCKDIKEKKIFNKKLTVLLLTRKTTAISYLLELNLTEILPELPEFISVYKIDEIENERLIKEYKLYAKASILFFVGNELKDIVYNTISKKAIMYKLNLIIKKNMQQGK